MAGVKGRSGGYRPTNPGGRPPSYKNSDAFREDLARAEKASIAAGNPSMAEALVELAKSDDKRTAAPAMKLFYDKVIIPQSEQKVETTKVTGPGIYLPEEKPVLATVTAITANKADNA